MDASGPIVPWTGDPALVCAACSSATSDKVPWARVSVTRAADGTVVRRTPIGSGCRECAEAALEAHLPNTLDWDTAVSDTATKEAVPNYVKLRRGEPRIFTKNSATALIRYSTTWQEEAEPVDVAELKLKYSSELLLRCGAQVDVLPARCTGQHTGGDPLPHWRPSKSALEHNRGICAHSPPFEARDPFAPEARGGISREDEGVGPAAMLTAPCG